MLYIVLFYNIIILYDTFTLALQTMYKASPRLNCMFELVLIENTLEWDILKYITDFLYKSSLLLLFFWVYINNLI